MLLHRFNFCKTIKNLILLYFLFFSHFAKAQEIEKNDPTDIAGIWTNAAHSMKIKVFQSGDFYYGTIVWLKDSTDANGNPRTDVNNPEESRAKRPLNGYSIMKGFTADSNNKVWTGGNIYDPTTGRTSRFILTLIKPNKLQIEPAKGKGKKDFWTR